MRASRECIAGSFIPSGAGTTNPKTSRPSDSRLLVVEVRLRPEAQLIEFGDGVGPTYDCSVQDLRLFADVEVRLEDGELLATAKMVELYVAASDDGTGGSFHLPASDALADVLWEDVATLPREIQISFGFSFVPDSELHTELSVSGWGREIDSSRPLGRAILDDPVPFDD